MSSDWPLKPLQLVASEVTVGYVGPMASEYVEFGVPFLRSLNIEPFGVNTNDLKFITPDFHKRIKKSILRPGDVAIVRTGKPGTCAVIPEWLGEANCSDLVVVRCGEEIRPHFLCYWVNSIASHHISSHTVGAVQQHFNVGAAKTMCVAVPSLKDQDKVLEVLRGLDDRITLLRKNISVDWAQRESVRAKLRLMVKRILRTYRYPPDLADAAVELVLEQAETIGDEWVQP